MDVCPVAKTGPSDDIDAMNLNGIEEGEATVGEGDQVERRIERVAFETDAHHVVGNVTLPPAGGYQSRFSDSLNRGDLEFVPLTNVEITSLHDGKVSERPFIVLSKLHIRIAYPIQG